MTTTTDNREIDFTRTLENIADYENSKGMPFTLNGVSGHIRVAGINLYHQADDIGRQHETYREHRRMLGDDYTTHFEYDTPLEIWAKVETLGLIAYK